MKKTYYNIFLLMMVCLLAMLKSYSQGQFNHPSSGTITIPNFAPSSPEAAALGKYGDIPVGLNTGVPNISIPVYQLKLKGISVPVSISYHSSGVKVDEVSTNVGLGWTLDAGGVITQSVYGLNDYGTGGWPFVTPKTPQTGLLPTSWAINPNNPQPYDLTPSYQLNRNSAMGFLDTQPDLFSFSLPGNSGKFFFDQDQTIHLMPHKNLKIEPVINNYSVSSYVITDENGNKFYFFDPEVNNTQSVDCSNSITGVSNDRNVSFYLSKIITPDNEEIDFHYGYKGYYLQNQISETRYWTSSSPRPGEYLGQILPNCITESHSMVDGIRLTGIENVTSGEKVQFIYGTTDRADLPGANSLNQIKIFNKNDVVINQFDLGHDYFGGPVSSSNPLAYRLKLTSVQELGKQPYLFQYNAIEPPARLSYAQDFWGYYNGELGNTTLLPNEHSPYFDTGANRDANSDYTQAGILTQITYPTGGYSTFTYENNVSYVDEYQGHYVDGFAGGAAIANQTQTINFTVPDNALDFRAQWTSSYTGSGNQGGLNPGGSNNTHIVLTGPSNQYFNGSLSFDSGNSNGIEKLMSLSQEQQALSAGNYTITITNTNNSGEPPTEFLNIYWKALVNTHIQSNMIAGGLRVKSISSHPLVGQVRTTNYEYGSTDNPSISSGVLMNRVVFRYDYLHSQPTNGNGNITIHYLAQRSTPQVPLGTIQGQNVIYGNVNVYDEDKHNGYTSNEFTTNGLSMTRFSVLPVPDFPFQPTQTIDWLQGLPVKTTVYKYNSAANNYFPLSINQKSYKTRIGSATSDFYDSDINNSHEYYVRGAKVAYLYPSDVADNASSEGVAPSVGSGVLPDQFAIGYYYLYSSWFHLDQETNTNYDTSGQNPLVVTTNYYYDNPTHIQLTRTVTTKSDGKTLTRLSTYPDDYASGTTFLDDMKTYHEVGLPIEQVSYENDGIATKILSGQVTRYQTGGNSLPDKVYSWESVIPQPLSSFKFSDRSIGQLPYGTSAAGYSLDNLYHEKFTYNLYDNKGNPLTITLKDGPSLGYKWAYNQQYVVAACKNASNTEFYTENFEETGGTSGTAHTGLKYGTSASVSWSRPNSRLYVIDYWYWDGSAWKYKQDSYTSNGYTMTGSSTGYYDDVRIYPADAQMTTYTYTPLVGMTSMTDPKGQTTYFEYDSFQRLINIKDQYGNIVKHTDYHYQNQ